MSLRSPASALLAAALAIGAVATHAAAASPVALFTRAPAPAGSAALGLGDPPGAVFARLDPTALESARPLERLSVVLPTATGDLALDLERADVFLPGATVTTTDDAGSHRYAPDLSVFRGHAAGHPGSIAALSIGAAGVVGWVEASGRRYSVAPVAGALHRVIDESAAAPSATPAGCETDESVAPDAATLTRLRQRVAAAIAPRTRAVCNLAIDCDHDFYLVRFRAQTDPLFQYVMTLVAIVSLLFERDVGASIRLGYLNVWTTSGDPYDQGTTDAQLTQFKDYWNANRGNVVRTIAHLVSGHLTGGRAYIGELCSSVSNGLGYGVSGLTGLDAIPGNVISHDVWLLSHEIGHQFGAYHTQNCIYGTLGFCAVDALIDSCYAPEGSCYSGPVGIVPRDRGTIMSYCDQLPGGVYNDRLEFHPGSVRLMQDGIDAARCISVPDAQPPTGLTAVAAGAAARLTWTPSPSTGVLRYDLYRSRTRLDPLPSLAGSTTSTTFDDPVPWGTFYYRVRAIRSGDVSDASGECAFTRCPPVATAFAAGTQPRGVAAADFNGDGILDLAVTQNATGRVAVLLGQGAGGVWSGAYAAPAFYDAGAGPTRIVASDFNSDGITDLAVLDADGGGVSVLLGRGAAGIGDGTFAAPRFVPSSTFATALAAADLNGDGIVDLAVIDGVNELRPLFGQGTDGIGTGDFVRGGPVTVPGGGTADLLVTDVNGNGIPDLVVLRNNGLINMAGLATAGRPNGVFASGGASFTPVFPCASMAAGDLNGDGFLDVVVAAPQPATQPQRLFAFLGNGADGVPDATFKVPIASTTVADGSRVAVADFTGDGIPDVAVASNGALGAVAIQAGLGDGHFAPPMLVDLGAPVGPLLAADVDGDGVVDLLAVSPAAGTVSVIRTDCAREIANGVTLVAPNGGEQWIIGSLQAIRWTTDPGCRSIDLDRSNDGGLTWEPLASGVVGHSFPWIVTAPSSTHSRVRVRNATARGEADASDSNFGIVTTDQAFGAGPGTRLAIRSVGPNPARTEIDVEVTVPTPDPAKLVLLDIGGRRVGEQSFSPARSATRLVWGGLRLKPGIYLLRLEQRGARVGVKVAVLG